MTNSEENPPTSTTKTTTSQQQQPPFTFTRWVHYGNLKDKLTFNNVSDYSDLIQTIRQSIQLSVPQQPILLYDSDPVNNSNAQPLDIADIISFPLPQIVFRYDQTKDFNKVNEHGKFVNRTNELLTLSRVVLEVLDNSNPYDNNSTRPIALASQMWGSGKTSLALNFLKNIDRLFSEGKLNSREAEKIQQLKLISIDFRRFIIDRGVKLSIEKWVEFTIRSILVELNLNQNTFNPNSVLRSFLSENINQFRNIFLHFDEIDYCLMTSNSNNFNDEVRLIYTLWNEVFHQLIKIGVPVFVTGRSSILFSIGKQLFNSIGITSPERGRVEWIVLDSLKIEHIKQLLEYENIRFTQELLKDIFYLTGGIPRLIQRAIRFLQNPNYSNFSSKSFRDFLLPEYNAEVDPTSDPKFTPIMKSIYLELIRLAVFHIPFNLKTKIDPSHWQLPENTQANFSEVIKFYHIYIEPIHGKKEEVYLNFPQITIDQLYETTTNDLIKNRIGILNQIRYNALSLSTATPFELCFKECLGIRMVKGLETNGSLLFLNNSWVSENSIFSNDNKVFGNFPSFTSDITTANVESIRNFFNETNPNSIKVSKTLFYETWKLAKEKILYQSGPQSASSDFYLKFNNNLGLAFFIKSGLSRLIGIPELIEEIEKSGYSSNLKLVCVLVALNTNTLVQNGGYKDQIEFDNNNPKMKRNIFVNQKLIAFQFEPHTKLQYKKLKEDENNRVSEPNDESVTKKRCTEKSKVKKIYIKEVFTIPHNVQLIVLTNDGIKYLIGDKDFETMTNACEETQSSVSPALHTL
eukprot:gene5653-7038_t